MHQDPTHPWRIPLLAAGWFLVVLSPVVGAIPGPGGIFVFAAGLVLLLRNSHWCRRQYVRFKRRFPKIGDAADRFMRRPSALRRHQLSKLRAEAGD